MRRAVFVSAILLVSVVSFLFGQVLANPWDRILRNSTSNSIYVVSGAGVKAYGLYPVRDELVIHVSGDSVALALPVLSFTHRSSWLVSYNESVRVLGGGVVQQNLGEGMEGVVEAHQILTLDVGDYRGSVKLTHLDAKRGELCLNVELV